MVPRGEFDHRSQDTTQMINKYSIGVRQKRMAERVNIIQHTEGGKRPTDAVIGKFERILDIKLMVERSAEEETVIRKSSNRPMTMEDLYNQAKKEMRGD